MKDKLILVCAGSDARQAVMYQLPLLQLCIGVQPQGSLRRLSLPAHTSGNLLGLSDLGLESMQTEHTARACISEAKQCNMKGIFADFERNTPEVIAFLKNLEYLAAKEKIPLYVPLCHAKWLTSAILVAQSALSAGSLETYLTELNEQYPNRIAVSLRPICTDFTLPAEDSEGTAIAQEECKSKMERYGAQPFFSYELCAKYFTYMDENERAHFVLFDDMDTIYAKLQRLDALPVSCVFALYPDVVQLLDNEVCETCPNQIHEVFGGKLNL